MNDFLEERMKKLKQFQKDVRKKSALHQKVDVPSGLFMQCEKCTTAIYEKTLHQHAFVCPFCDFHFRMDAINRLNLTIDQGTFCELQDNLETTNPLSMPGYEKKIEIGQKLSKMKEAFLAGEADLVGIRIAIGILDSSFMMGSMGSVVGEKVTRLVEHATAQQLPLIIFSASGGARMQEGILSLMQMAKTSAALRRLDDAGLLYISVLTNPTTGGVAASFASLGDINIAEKSSLIGFAGARVIKQTIGQDLPEGFQTADFQLKHGQVDLVITRADMRKTLYQLLKLHLPKEKHQ